MAITNYSPKFKGLLHRAFEAEERKLLRTVYTWAEKNGGVQELDFEREAGVSFNPRPARIAHIMVETLGIKSATAVAAAILRTSNLEDLPIELILPPTVREIFQQSKKPINAREAEESEDMKYAAIIELVLWLDRARHLHLSRSTEREQDFEIFLQKTADYLTLAKLVSPKLEQLLRAWQERFERQKVALIKPLADVGPSSHARK